MGFTIDWGTLVVSVPVVATTTVGAVKFIAKAYFEKHIDEKIESYKNQLQKDYETHKNQLQKDYETHKNQLEKERVEEAKKFENKLKISSAYIEACNIKIDEIRELIKSKYFCVLEAQSHNNVDLEYPIENEISKYLESNLMYFKDVHIELIQQFIATLEIARKDKYRSHVSLTNKYSSAEKSWSDHQRSVVSQEELKAIYRSIEKSLQEDRSVAI